MNDKIRKLKSEVLAYKKSRILEEARKLFFADGYESTSLDRVAKNLHVTKPFIYSYYKNKSEILKEISATGITLSLAAVEEAINYPGNATVRLRRLVERVLKVIIVNQENIVVYQREEKNLSSEVAHNIMKLRGEFDQKLAGLLKEGKKSGEFSIGDPFLTAIYLSGMLTWTANWYRPTGRNSESEVIIHVMKLILKIVTDPDFVPAS
jgi:AcrR family transcriptional regulator